MGVWIETLILHSGSLWNQSHTLRGCVDWNNRWRVGCDVRPVTPFVGVWIETNVAFYCEIVLLSHPSWVCGLKHVSCYNLHSNLKSHPSWVCGLKQNRNTKNPAVTQSHPSWVCGLKLWKFIQIFQRNESHPSWVCGLKPKRPPSNELATPSHPSWVCGLKL